MAICDQFKSIRVANFIQNRDYSKGVLFRTKPVYLRNFKTSKLILIYLQNYTRDVTQFDRNIYKQPSTMILSEGEYISLA